MPVLVRPAGGVAWGQSIESTETEHLRNGFLSLAPSLGLHARGPSSLCRLESLPAGDQSGIFYSYCPALIFQDNLHMEGWVERTLKVFTVRCPREREKNE